ncbi:hypothetical protein BT69DRAFT_1347587 [Atractiella rhizophila]|nr:hypothetical protein BT69DRAFT_1347587 [Atractiella rhizophila]
MPHSLLVDSFFTRDHAGKNLVDKAKFSRNLLLPPNHSSFPHLSLIHAICAIGARFVSRDTFSFEFEGVPKYWLSAGTPENYHAQCAKEFIDEAIAQGRKLFQVAQAIVLVSFYAYSHARYVEVWLYCGLGTRLATPLGLNHLEGTYKGDTGKKERKETAGKPSILPPPVDDQETFERASTFWSAFCCDRFASASTGWATSIDEADISTLLPVPPGADVGSYNHTDSPLSISSPDFLTSHPPHLVTSFQLHIKSVVLLGRVVTFMQRAPWPIGKNLSRGVAGAPKHLASVPLGTPLVDVRNSNEFKRLDADVVKFRLSFPKDYSNMLAKNEDGQVDSNLVTAHVIPHVLVPFCTILLHEPFCSLKDEVSMARCLTSARAILSSIYLLWSSSYEIALLSPFVNWCWAVAGRTLVREIAVKELKGDAVAAASTRQEVEVILAAMTGYGQRAPLGLNSAENLRRLLNNPSCVLDETDDLCTLGDIYPNGSNIHPIDPVQPTSGFQPMEVDPTNPLDTLLQQMENSRSNSNTDSPANSSSNNTESSPGQQPGATPQSIEFSSFLLGFESPAPSGSAIGGPFSSQADQMKTLLEFMEKNGLGGTFNSSAGF